MIASPHNFDLGGQAPRDQRRHREKVKDAIKDQLGDLVGQESIITSDGKKIVKVPIRGLDHPRFRHDPNDGRPGYGQGPGKIGDVIGQESSGQGPGKGKQAGDIPGIDYYEAEITVDELAAMAFEDMGLPWLANRGKAVIPSEETRFDTYRKKGTLMDKRRSVRENLLRNARAGNPHVGDWQDDDLRYKSWTQHTRETSNAVIIAMRDVSGSMGEFEKYISRTLYSWMFRFLRTQYEQVEVVFITHHSEAKEVDENAFFYQGESGGTKVSSAYELALDITRARYPAKEWNTYPYHCTDGDNWGDVDNKRCVDTVKSGLETDWNAFGYAWINEGGRGSANAGTLTGELEAIKNPRLTVARITNKTGVFPALKQFFSADQATAAALGGL